MSRQLFCKFCVHPRNTLTQVTDVQPNSRSLKPNGGFIGTQELAFPWGLGIRIREAHPSSALALPLAPFLASTSLPAPHPAFCELTYSPNCSGPCFLETRLLAAVKMYILSPSHKRRDFPFPQAQDRGSWGRRPVWFCSSRRDQ